MAGWVGQAQVERLVDEAVKRHDLALTLERIRTTGERRRFDVDLDQTGLDGLVPISGRVELPDALVLDAAVAHAAQELAELGSTDPLSARRARGLGDLAREHLELWEQLEPSGRLVVDTDADTLTPVVDEQPDPVRAAPHGRPVGAGPRARASKRQVVLHVHLTDATIIGTSRRGALGRVDNTNVPIDAATIRDWCGQPHTRVTVMPVLDLAEQIHTERYEIPDRLREQVIARDTTCVYPGCRAPDRRCDLDHIDPFDRLPRTRRTHRDSEPGTAVPPTPQSQDVGPGVLPDDRRGRVRVALSRGHTRRSRTIRRHDGDPVRPLRCDRRLVGLRML